MLDLFTPKLNSSHARVQIKKSRNKKVYNYHRKSDLDENEMFQVPRL